MNVCSSADYYNPAANSSQQPHPATRLSSNRVARDATPSTQRGVEPEEPAQCKSSSPSSSAIHKHTTMTRRMEDLRHNDSIRLSVFEMDGSMNDSAQTLVNGKDKLKPVHDEFLSFVRSQEGSLSQLSFAVNDSASDKTFEQVYEMGDVLGEGGFAFVYQCRHLTNHHTYAVKEVIKKENSQGDEIKDEIAALRRVKECPHFVRLLDVFEAPTTFYMIMEEMQGGDLLDKLAEIEVYEEWEARKVARTLLEAVQYCHQRKIAHRDIKPENILLPRADDIAMIKLADFGCAKQWNDGYPNELHTLCGSPQYVAPEVVGDSRPEGEGYNCQCDLWSCGVVLYIILGGYAPFESEDEHELLDLICNAEYEFHEEYWDDIEESPKDLISQLLEPEPQQRLTARQALRSPWLRRRDGDWVKEASKMDESSSNASSSTTFGRWLEKRNTLHGSLHGTGHVPTPPTSTCGEEDHPPLQLGDSNHSLTPWDFSSDSHTNTTNDDSKLSFAAEEDALDLEAAAQGEAATQPPASMQDSSNANVFNVADSSAE